MAVFQTVLRGAIGTEVVAINQGKHVVHLVLETSGHKQATRVILNAEDCRNVAERFHELAVEIEDATSPLRAVTREVKE